MSGSEPWQRDFERHRGHLWAVAYRILGTVSDADDAVQETWLRWRRSDHGSVTDQRGYLTTIVSRICYDLLASARARRETYVGEWLPEPVITDQDGPDDRVVMDESVSVALLAVMERLTPAERIAFVLHDVFAVPFDEIAAIVERTPDAVRQLASRARRRLREYAPRRSMDWAAHGRRSRRSSRPRPPATCRPWWRCSTRMWCGVPTAAVWSPRYAFRSGEPRGCPGWCST